MRWFLMVFLAAFPGRVIGETVVTARTVRSHEILSAGDLMTIQENTPGALARLSDVVGLEARVTLYSGRPVRAADVGPPTLVDRNQQVVLVFSAGGLEIKAEGRSLGRAAAGESVKVMNLASRKTVFGIVAADGTVTVGTSGR